MSKREWGNRVKGYCPACGAHDSMFVASGGYLTCSIDKCPNPTLIADIITKRGWAARAESAEAALRRVRDLHREDRDGCLSNESGICSKCRHVWPCATYRAAAASTLNKAT